MKTKIYYSIVNGGDGSAYPAFFLDEKVAELHQEAESISDGWGEPCCGLALTITSKEPCKIDGITSTKEVIADFKERLADGFYGEKSEEAAKEVESIIKKLEKI